MTPEAQAIWTRMPETDRARVLAVPPGEYHEQLVWLWDAAQANKWPDSGTAELDEANRICTLALEGKLGHPCQRAVEARWGACVRVTGSAPSGLAESDPGAYQAFLRGCVKAVRRVRLLECGDLSQREHHAMWAEHTQRQAARQFDDALDEPVGWR